MLQYAVKIESIFFILYYPKLFWFYSFAISLKEAIKNGKHSSLPPISKSLHHITPPVRPFIKVSKNRTVQNLKLNQSLPSQPSTLEGIQFHLGRE